MHFFFAAGPARAIRDALLLVYRPPLLDIVPLYIIFLLLSPVAIYLAARIGWKFVWGGLYFGCWLSLGCAKLRTVPGTALRPANSPQRDGRV
jgi:hypothetical protein